MKKAKKNFNTLNAKIEDLEEKQSYLSYSDIESHAYSFLF